MASPPALRCVAVPLHHVFLMPGFFGFANLGEIRYFGHVRDFLGEALHELGIAAELHAERRAHGLARAAPRACSKIRRPTARDAGPSTPRHSRSEARPPYRRLARARLPPRSKSALARAAYDRTLAPPHRGTPAASSSSGALVRAGAILRPPFTAASRRRSALGARARGLPRKARRPRPRRLHSSIRSSTSPRGLHPSDAQSAGFFAKWRGKPLSALTPEARSLQRFGAERTVCSAEARHLRATALVGSASRRLDPAAHATHEPRRGAPRADGTHSARRVWQLAARRRSRSAPLRACPMPVTRLRRRRSRNPGARYPRRPGRHLDLIGHFDDSRHGAPLLLDHTGPASRPGFRTPGARSRDSSRVERFHSIAVGHEAPPARCSSPAAPSVPSRPAASIAPARRAPRPRRARREPAPVFADREGASRSERAAPVRSAMRHGEETRDRARALERPKRHEDEEDASRKPTRGALGPHQRFPRRPSRCRERVR